MGVSATGLKSFKVDTFGFLGTGIISAVFQPIGTLWSFKERLKMYVKIKLNSLCKRTIYPLQTSLFHSNLDAS